VDLREFLLGLFAQASALLAGGAHADPKPDPEGARYLIAILEMLRDKTEGRRTTEEGQVLEGILYELRMAYVAQTGVTGA
jgi:hypothetical protein